MIDFFLNLKILSHRLTHTFGRHDLTFLVRLMSINLKNLLKFFFIFKNRRRIFRNIRGKTLYSFLSVMILGLFLNIFSIKSDVLAHGFAPFHGQIVVHEENVATKRLPLISIIERIDDAKSPLILLAHAIVVRTSPPQGGEASGNIGKVDVWYDAGIRDSLAALAVVNEAGERVDKKDAAIDSADPAHVSVGVSAMTSGKYTVRYRALSADGHMVSGTWDFQVK
jgi:methionine-rich copper-binding protein CopC